MPDRTNKKLLRWGPGVTIAICLVVLPLAAIVWRLCPRHGDVVRRQFAVPITVSGKPIPTALLLECDVEPINVTLESWHKWHAGPLQRRVAALVAALRAGDVETAKSFWKPDGLNTANDVCRMAARHFERIGVLPDLSNFTICGRIYWGPRHIFIYEIVGTKPAVTGFLAFEMAPRRGWLWTIDMDDGFSEVLWTMTRATPAALTDWDSPQTLKDNFRYRFTIADDKGAHPVDLLFNGRPCDLAIPGDPPPDADPAAAFYARLQTALADANSVEAFRQIGNRYYEGHSRDKFLRWLNDYNAFLEWRRREEVRARTIRFVIDADPVFIVFYHPNGRAKSCVEQAYIIRRENRLYITRLALSDDISRLLESRKKFIEPLVLRLDKQPGPLF